MMTVKCDKKTKKLCMKFGLLSKSNAAKCWSLFLSLFKDNGQQA
jgi:hypothetical protein